MAMPQVHIVAYCVDLGYGTARGAEMLAIMTPCGIVSRLGSGWIADRVGGLKTLLLGSTAQAVALLGYLVSDGLVALYLVSALFGLFQGGIIPSYGMIVREYFPPREAGTRMGIAISATIVGMALGGWMGGALFDLTGSYRAAFINGIAWNVLNGAIVWWLLSAAEPAPADERRCMTRGDGIDSAYAWRRLAVSVTLSTLGGIGMWALAVAMPAVQADLGVSRADISFAYSMNMLGFFAGGVIVGRLVDRRGIVVASILSALGLGAGFALAPLTSSLILFAAAQVLIGFSAAATFAPLVADISHWFEKRRGVAVAIAASGNYIAGAIWPPIVELMIRDHGWRTTYCSAAALLPGRHDPAGADLEAPPRRTTTAGTPPPWRSRSLAALGLSPNALQALLIVAGIGCCVAMSMPQVHIVAYCADLGYGVARGAEMLSLMLGFGIVSRIGSGWLADRVGGVMTLLIGSTLQCVALVFYLIADSLTSLYSPRRCSACSRAASCRPTPSSCANTSRRARRRRRVGLTVSSTIVGMALGGWMGGVLFDMTGSYRAAFINGIAWNVLNAAIAWWLLSRQMRRAAAA